MDLLGWVKEHASTEPAQTWVQVSATHRFPARLIAVPVPEEVAIKRQADVRRRAQKHSQPVNDHLLMDNSNGPSPKGYWWRNRHSHQAASFIKRAK